MIFLECIFLNRVDYFIFSSQMMQKAKKSHKKSAFLLKTFDMLNVQLPLFRIRFISIFQIGMKMGQASSFLISISSPMMFSLSILSILTSLLSFASSICTALAKSARSKIKVTISIPNSKEKTSNFFLIQGNDRRNTQEDGEEI